MTFRTVASAGLLGAYALSAAAGGPISWLNAVDGDWSVAANWDPASVPGISDSVVIGLTGPFTVNASQNQAAASITISNPDATLAVAGFRTLTVDGGVSNQGLIIVNPLQINAATRLVFSANASLSGSGTLLLNSPGVTSELATGTGVLLSHGAGHTIAGGGRITAALTNDGLVVSDLPGGVLTMFTNAKTNNATFRAENGAALSFEGIDVLQGPAGQIVVDGDGSEARFSASTLDGGLLLTQNDGRGVVINSSTFRGVTLQGAAEIDGFRTLTIEQSLLNNGVLTVNPTLINAGTALALADGASIGGTGEIVLAAPSSTSEIRSTGVGVPVHGADHTIRGRGRISAAMTNEGLISADVPTGTMELLAQPKTNNARVEAVNGATVEASGVVITQAPDAIMEADGADSAIHLSGATIVSGTLSGVNGGVVSVRQSSSVQDVTLEGAADIQGFRFLTVDGTLTNNGVITVNPTLINSGTGLRFEDGAVLGGTGRVVLANAATTSAVSNVGGGMSMTHAQGHTIEGRGRIDALMTNNGLINANATGQVMEIIGNPKTNNASMVADQGGQMNFFAVNVDQSGAGVIRAQGAGSVIDLAGATITGGTLESTEGGLIQLVGGNATLNAVSLRGETSIGGFRFLDIDQGTTLDGRVTVNPTSINAGTGIRFLSEFTLEGQGVIRLVGTSSTSTIGALAGVASAGLGEGIRVEGIGRLQIPLTAHGELAPGLDGVGTLSAGSPLSLTGTSSFEAQVAGDQSSDLLASSSTFVADGTLNVSFVDGFDPPLSWTATIVTTAANGVSGAFDTVNAPQPADSRLEFRVVYGASQIRIGAFCKADSDGDGILNFFDISNFIADYNAGDPAADIAAPFGSLNFFDIAEFIARYNTGCP